MAISRETLRLARELRRSVDSITDDRTRQLVRAWVVAWDEIAPALLAGIDDAIASTEAGSWPTRAQIVRSQRLMLALDMALTQLADLAKAAGQATSADATAAARTAAEAQARLIASQMPPQPGTTTAQLATRFDRLDPAALEAIVVRTTQQITALHYPISAAAYDVIIRELIRGVAVGDNPREAARRMLARVEGHFNGGLHRALVIARTEILDVHRAAAAAAQQANTDVLAGWVWHAKLDKLTCPSCWSKHGRLYPTSAPGPLDHQQGRCSRTPQAKSWRQLGFNVDEPPSLMPDAEAVFRALPVDDQLTVMGPARLAALNTGRATWADLSTRRTTTGWRDSYAPTPTRQFAA